MTFAPEIVFAGGGTGGHFYPGLAVAQQLTSLAPRAQITFAGSGKAAEQQQAVAAGYRYLSVPSRPRPASAWQMVRFVSDNFAGLLAARWFLRERDVQLVVGLGSYASAPMVRAAIGLDIPTLLLEANAAPGRVTRWLAPTASLTCVAFEEAADWLRGKARVAMTGTPIRRAFVRLAKGGPNGRSFLEAPPAKQLLVLGGSGGARSLNSAAPAALCRIRNRLAGWRVVHQTGPGQVQEIQELYSRLGIDALVVSYIDSPADAMLVSDLVISRAGGGAIAELAALGRPTVFVPYPEASDGHQRANAAVLAEAGACRLVEEAGDTPFEERLAETVAPLLESAPQRRQLENQIRRFARPQAAHTVAQAALELLPHHATRQLSAAA